MENKNTTRYSRQRECILNVLAGTKTHPTANWIYDEVRKDIASISLGTIYRNLSKLCDDGTIIKLDIGDGSERYDYCNTPHYHLFCKNCGGLVDVDMEYTVSIDREAIENCGVCVDFHTLLFCGLCEKCNKKNQ